MPRAANARLILLAAAFCLMAPGCTGSRWARSHPGYAAKYPHHTGNLGRMTKQAIDARHVAGETGFYAGAVGQDDPPSAGVNFGMLHFPKLYAGSVEWHGGLQGLLTSGDQPISGGLNGGIRLQTPSRLAPFVGVGAYVGSAPGEPDSGEESDALLAAYPEAGVHLWLTPRVRMTGSASYYVTTSEVNREFPLVGLSLTYLPFESPTEHVPLADRGAPFDCGEALDASESWPSEPWPNRGEPSSQPWPEPADTSTLSSPPAVNPAYESLPLLAP